MKFKIGDLVEVTKNNPNGSMAVIGEKYYIVEDKGYGYSLGKEKGVYERCMSIGEEYIKLIKKEEELEEKYEEGEEVEVSNGYSWNKRIYLTALPGNALSKYVTIVEGDEEGYRKGESFDTINRTFIRKINKEEERKIVCTDDKWEEIQKLLKLK